jgi:hypothetical protein
VRSITANATVIQKPTWTATVIATEKAERIAVQGSFPAIACTSSRAAKTLGVTADSTIIMMRR